MGNKYTVPLNVGAIRESCFRPADKWTPPTGDELRYLLENVLNLSQEGLARHVGVNGRRFQPARQVIPKCSPNGCGVAGM